MNPARLTALTLSLAMLAGCTGDPSAAAMESLAAPSLSPKYNSDFWASEAQKKSPLWQKAQTYCLIPDHVQAPNCRIVIAVDVTVLVFPVRPGEDPSERVKAWVQRGAREVPPYVPGKGFGPEPPKMPKPPGR